MFACWNAHEEVTKCLLESEKVDADHINATDKVSAGLE